MKKVLFLLLTMVLTVTLCGCSAEDKVTSNTCTMTASSGVETTYEMTATNDQIDKIVLTMKPDNSLFGVESLNILDDAAKEQVKTSMLKTLGLDSDSYEGISIDIDINDTMIITVNVDLKVADEEILKKIGMDFSDANMSLEDAVKEMKESGATCE